MFPLVSVQGLPVVSLIPTLFTLELFWQVSMGPHMKAEGFFGCIGSFAKGATVQFLLQVLTVAGFILVHLARDQRCDNFKKVTYTQVPL